jgi:hypothetical protein
MVVTRTNVVGRRVLQMRGEVQQCEGIEEGFGDE